MGISHQTGSIVLRGKAWYGSYRKEVIDPTTEDVRPVRVCVRLGLKSQMTKLKARDALKAEIAKQTAQLADGRMVRSQPLLSASAGRLAARNGEGEDGSN
jgi:hypothetical protein